MTMGELSAADVAAVTRPNLMGYGMGGFGNGFGYGGDWILGLIAIAAIFGGGFGGFGFGGGGAGAAGLGLQAGFDTQNILRNQDSIKNGLCDGFYAMNTNNLQAQNQLQRDLCNGFAAVNAAINASAAADQRCCCETQRQIDNVRYDLTTTDNTNTQKILDKLCNMELSAKDQKIADLMAANQSKDLVISQFNQNNYLAIGEDIMQIKSINNILYKTDIKSHMNMKITADIQDIMENVWTSTKIENIMTTPKTTEISLSKNKSYLSSQGFDCSKPFILPVFCNFTIKVWVDVYLYNFIKRIRAIV